MRERMPMPAARSPRAPARLSVMVIRRAQAARRADCRSTMGGSIGVDPLRGAPKISARRGARFADVGRARLKRAVEPQVPRSQRRPEGSAASRLSSKTAELHALDEREVRVSANAALVVIRVALTVPLTMLLAPHHLAVARLACFDAALARGFDLRNGAGFPLGPNYQHGALRQAHDPLRDGAQEQAP